MPPILITGASRGIGFELVRLCLERGYRVLATHRPGPEAPRPLVDLAAGHPGRIRLIPIDLTNLPALANLSSRLAERIDVLINSAGVVVDMRSEADGSGRVFYEHSLRGGSTGGSKRMSARLSPAGGGGALLRRAARACCGLPRCSQSITSRQTGAAPLIPETSCIGLPLALPTQTPTV